jgi:shikimate kinase
MGAGKSTVGRRLAKLLVLPFFDSDAEIARAHGSIEVIFAQQGEAKFREYEREALLQLVARPPCVIAVGGGAVVAPENRALLRARGVIVHLDISAAAAHRRVLRRTHRPLLGAIPEFAVVRALLRQRAPAYADNDFSVAVEGKSPGAIAQLIAAWYGPSDTASKDGK